jgi:hypothetical protein
MENPRRLGELGRLPVDGWFGISHLGANRS